MKFKIGGELSHLNRGGSVTEDMFIPEFGKTDRGEGFDLARDQDVVEIIPRQAVAVDRKPIEVNLAALPSDELFEVDIEHSFEAAIVYRAATHAARHVRLDIADVGE